MMRLHTAIATAAALATGILLHAQTTSPPPQTPARGQAPVSAPSPGRAPAQSAPALPPKLVVLLVADQFPSYYETLYGRQWTGGLHRLFNRGAVFPLAEYPYANTVTCPGHFTIGTGSLPFIHGMVTNEWYDPQTRRLVLCSTDRDATNIAFGGGTVREHSSPRALQVPTFADELRLQAATPPHIVSVALKPRSAIGLSGHGGPNTVVVWEEDNGTWVTSDAYTKTPWPEVDAFVRAHPLPNAYGQVWTPLRPPSFYLGDDDAVGEASPGLWGRTFPHKLDSRTGNPDNTFVSAWERSPWSDAFVADLGSTLADTYRLGQHGGTDVLAMSFAALDIVSHEYGPRSHEVQDVLVRLDARLGQLFDALDRRVGAGRYVVAFSSDHGTTPVPEQSAASGLDAGRIKTSEIRAAAQGAMAKLLGEGAFYGAFSSSNIYLTAGTLERLRAIPGAIDTVRAAIAGVNGIARVYGPDDLAGTAPTNDPYLTAWRLSYMPGRSGDFVVLQKPYWIADATGTTHGSPYEYDRRVPVVFMGAGIKPGRYLGASSPVDIAPTLAFLTHVTLAHTDGRVLIDALIRQP